MAGGAKRWRVFGGLSAVLAALVARKMLIKTWKAATGRPPPANPADPQTEWHEALAWAVVSGAAVGVARLLASRKAADYWRRSTGHLPPGVEEVA
jgi:hypothetical protein